MPGTPVCSDSSTTGPEVACASSTPAALDSSFSGISPTDSNSVSQANRFSVPGIGLRRASTCATVTPSTRSRPWISVTVWLNINGILKSSRHCTTLRVSPLEYGISSTHASTCAPSNVIRRAMMSPMSPEPRITTRRPGIQPSMFTNRCAVPAV